MPDMPPLGAVLARLLFLAVVVGGVVAMHTSGHLSAHGGHGRHAGPGKPAGVALLSATPASAGSTSAEHARTPEVGGAGMAGPASVRVKSVNECHGEKVPHCPDHAFDSTAVCLAVLTVAVALSAGWLCAWPTRWAGGAWRSSVTAPAAEGWDLSSLRTPSLARLSVLRI